MYSAPRASVRTNNTRSEYFNLYRSTRQGCPLSPLLFAIAIEPLSATLKSNPLIKGVTRLGIEQKVSLYADDILLYISDFSVSVHAVLNVIKLFGFISGYKLNLNKSEFFPLNAVARKYPSHILPFKIAQHSFKYLGVCITNRFQDLLKFYFDNLLLQIQKDFER